MRTTDCNAADGITYSFGVFLVTLMGPQGFNDDNRGAASLIPSILVGVTLGSGPIASYFTNRHGCRPVTIAGAVLAAAGLALSTLASSIAVLYFTVGILTGLTRTPVIRLLNTDLQVSGSV